MSNARSNLREAPPVVPREVWEVCNELWTALREGETSARTRDHRVRWLRTVVDQSTGSTASFSERCGETRH